MSAINPNVISSRITNPLKEVSQRQWTVLAARGVFQTLVASLAVLLAVSMLLGWLSDLPMIPRIALAAIAWGTVVWAAIHYLRPALARWSLTRAAQFAEQSIPDSEERISSAVELSQADHAFRGSPELVAHLISQAEADAGRVNVAHVVPLKTVFVWMLAFVPVLALWLVLALNSHTNHALLHGLFATLTPWKVAPDVLSDVSVKPGDVVLAQGDSLDIIAIVSANGGKPAKSANLIRTFASGQSTSESLEQIKGTQFARTFTNLAAQDFKYQVVTDHGGKSALHSVKVNPRPAISRLDVHLEYPKYTGQDPRTFMASDGNIDAIVGTKVTLTLTTSDALVNDKSHLIFDEGQPESTTVAILPGASKNVYTASFDVVHGGNYRLRLLNEYNLPNKDDDARAITAEPDQPPVVTIQLPREQITVRPDDEVSVMYIAGDDYGVATLQALVQIDDKAEQTLPVVIRSKDRRNIKDQWTISIPAMLRSAGAPNATRISYQLKATDNRDPDPQTGLSTRQILIIDKNEKNSFQDKLNQMRKEDLKAAIQKAIDRLNHDLGPIANVRDRIGRESDPRTLHEASDLRDHIGNTGKDLSSAADNFLETPFADVAKKAKSIADNGIASSADEMARLTLDAANRETARTHGDSSYREAAKARDELQRLLEEVEKAEKKAEAAEELKQAAREQAEIAKEMAEHPENVDQNRQKQQDAINKLQEAMQKDPSLQNQQAQQLAQKLSDLETKVEQQEQKQTELQNQTAQQQEKQQAEKAANELAEAQKKLNEKEQQFAKDDKKPLDQAQADAPDQKQQDQLVKNIEKNQLQDAAQQAQKAAEQLKQDADKLNAQAKKADPSAAQAKQQKQDQQNTQDAQDAQKQASDAAQDLKNQSKKPDQNADANQQDAEKTEKAAKAIAKAAERVEQANEQGAKNADVKKAAEAAKADAQQAAKDAQEAANAQNPQDAAKDEAKAAQELAQAGQELNQAAQAEAKADQSQMQEQAKADRADAAKAAEEAQGLAQEQQEIASALAQQAQQQADAGMQSKQQLAQAQQQAAQQTEQAKQTAKQLARQAKDQQDQALADRADKAAEALGQAEKDQQQAAQADAAGKPEEAGKAEADAQQALAKAEQALRGNPEQAQADADQGQGQPEQGQGQPGQTPAQAAQQAARAQQQAMQPNPNAAADAAQALANAAQAAEDGLPGNEPGDEPGNHASPKAAQASDPKKGMVGEAEGGDNKPPASVSALGISSTEWAKLPPIMQRELMNASQQSGPPAYKQMIKNYYVRVARMQNDHAAAGPKQ